MRHLIFTVLFTASFSLLAFAEDSPSTKSKIKETKKPNDLGKEIKLFDGKSLKNWRIVDTFDFMSHGKVEVSKGVIRLGRGKPATGISWKKKLPQTNYEVSWKGRRTEGSDFFCGLTFPVGKSFCTLILGGWGGSLVGLSNIDDFNASENGTTQVIEFKNNQWYDVRLRVTDENLFVWLDNKKIIEVERKDHTFSIYWEQEPVTPLGIVTWYTAGEIKDLTFHELAANPKGSSDEKAKTTDKKESGKD